MLVAESNLETHGTALRFAEDEGIQVVGEGHSGGIRGAFQGHSGPKKGIQEYGSTSTDENVRVFETSERPW